MNNWTFSSTANDPQSGVVTNDGGLSIVFTGPNDGSGNPGTSGFVINAAAAGPVQFSWTFSTADDAQADTAGYLLSGVFTLLADTNGQSGLTSFAVSAGQSFGFQMGSVDDLGEPGVLTISNFNAPIGASVPEPSSISMMALASTGITLRGRKVFTNYTKGKA